MIRVREGRKTFLTIADQSNIAEIDDLRKRSAEFHKPWIYHGDIKVFAEKIASCKTIAVLVRSAQDGHLVAVINLNEPVRGALQSAYLGYYIDEQHSGKGIMTEGLKLTLDYAFTELRFHRLEANIQPGNAASIALVKRLGFRMEGFSPKYLRINDKWCDHERWAILIDDCSSQSTNQ